MIPRSLILASAVLLAGCGPDAPSTEAEAPAPEAGASIRTDTFSFEVGGSRLVGLLDTPTDRDATSTIVLVHGYGGTNVVAGNGYADLRAHFAALGINVLVWDKPGHGMSEGEFDIDQPVESSAEEVVAAVHALRGRGIPGSDRIGLWGRSRAGWIAPLAIRAEPSVAFWISVSGVDDRENARYLLASNLPIEGRSAEETERLVDAWQRSVDAVWRGGSYEEYLEAASELGEDPFVQFMGWGQPATREKFLADQARFERGELTVDEESGLPVYVRGFRDLLSSLDLPVLALFGEKDTNVDWRETAELYRETIGENPRAELSVRVFTGANHDLEQSRTGGVREGRTRDAPYAEGYLDAMAAWLVSHGFGSRPAPAEGR